MINFRRVNDWQTDTQFLDSESTKIKLNKEL